MEYETWEKYYRKILSDFNFDRKMDERAAYLLSKELLNKQTVSLKELEDTIRNKHTFVFGGGDTLIGGVKKFKDSEKTVSGGIITISADGTTTYLLKNDILPDIIVTDLDGKVDDQIIANEKGSIVVIHAHGDNIKALEKFVPKFDGKIIGTTQAEPLSNVFNFGGFTDGDRCVFLAAHFCAKKITLIGFDYVRVGKMLNKKSAETKLKKLMWARKLIEAICKETEVELRYW